MVHENISAGRNYEFFILPFFAMRRISNLKEKSFKTKKTANFLFLRLHLMRGQKLYGASAECVLVHY